MRGERQVLAVASFSDVGVRVQAVILRRLISLKRRGPSSRHSMWPPDPVAIKRFESFRRECVNNFDTMRGWPPAICVCRGQLCLILVRSFQCGLICWAEMLRSYHEDDRIKVNPGS